MCYNATFTMVTVADNEVKERLDELLTAAEGGQTVAITRNGKAVAQIAPAPAVSNGEYDSGQRFKQLDAALARTDEEKEIVRQKKIESLRSLEEMREEFRKKGYKGPTREDIMEVIDKMRGR